MKKKSKSNIFKYAIIFLFCLLVAYTCSCDSVLKKAESLSTNIPFNYPGLRLETRYLKSSEIDKSNPKIICFGDSVTFGWNLSYDCSYPFLLEQHLLTDYPDVMVINSGIGGNTVIDGLARIKKNVLKYNPELVILNFGLNDAMLGKKSKSAPGGNDLYYKEGQFYFLPQINIYDFEQAYRDIIDTLKEENIDVLVLSMNPVLDNFPLDKDEDFSKKQKEIYQVYNKRIKEVAKEKDTDIIDLWDVFIRKENLQYYIQDDGLHPSEEGQCLISDEVAGYISGKDFFN